MSDEQNDFFPPCIDFVLKWEGGYVNNHNDPGRETNFGISKKFHPKVDIKNLTKEGASQIYKDDYWIPCRANRQGWPLCLVLFDTAVNCGIFRARSFLDLALANDPNSAWRAMISLRFQYYKDLVEKKPTLKAFLAGWENRLKALEATASQPA